MNTQIASRLYAARLTAIVLLILLWIAVRASSGQTAAPSENAAPPAAEQTAQPLDATAESGIANKSLLGIVRDGGVLMFPLLVCSFALMVFTFERAISLRTGRVIPGPFVKRFLHQLEEGQLDREHAIRICEENGSPTATIFAAAARKWGRSAVEVEQAVIDAGERVSNELRRYLRVFNCVATIGPLLGLLGTVFGIIRAFNDIALSDAMGRMEMLSKGISEALLTTAMGLLVAIPAVVLHLYFVSRVDRLVMRIDSLGQQVVHTISAEALQEAAQPRRTRKAA